MDENVRRVCIMLYDEEPYTNIIEIESKECELYYVDYGPMHGMQCKYSGEEPEYEEIQKRLQKIADLVKEIDAINQRR